MVLAESRAQLITNVQSGTLPLNSHRLDVAVPRMLSVQVVHCVCKAILRNQTSV